jgi:hypothetical protein
MKKIITLVVVLALIIVSSSCGATNLIRKEFENNNSADDLSNKIVQCINNGNKDGFAEEFCEKDRNDDNFSTEVNELFDFFTDRISSYDINYIGETRLTTDEKGNIERQLDEINIDNIVIGSNKVDKYSIIIERYVENIIEKDEKGIVSFQVRNSQNDSILTVGCD